MNPKPRRAVLRTIRYLIQAAIVVLLAAGATPAIARPHHHRTTCHQSHHRHHKHRASCHRLRHRAHVTSLPPTSILPPFGPLPATPGTPQTLGTQLPPGTLPPPPAPQPAPSTPPPPPPSTMYTISMGQLYNAQSSPGVPDGVWNTPLANNAPIDPESTNLVGVLDKWFPGSRGSRANFSVMNQIRIWIAGSTTPLVKVKLDPGAGYQQDLQQAFNQVPFPAGAQPSPTSDERMAILQPSSGCIWEFWHLSWNTIDASWHASWGGRTCQVWTDYGAFRNVEDSAGNVLGQANWGGSAASLANYAGAMKVDELAHGAIPHAIAFAIDASANCQALWSIPAGRTDGGAIPVLDLSGRPTNCIPEGARFRLPPPCSAGTRSTPGVCFNLSDLAGDPPIIQQMAAAAQTYGMIDENSTSGGVVGVESGGPGDPPYIALGGNPYTTAIPGEANTPFLGSCSTCTNQNDLALFPWNYLELVQMNISSTPSQIWFTQPDPPAPLWPS